MSILSVYRGHFSPKSILSLSDKEAFVFFKKIRWGKRVDNGIGEIEISCPVCGTIDKFKRNLCRNDRKMQWSCFFCRRTFSETSRTIFRSSTLNHKSMINLLLTYTGNFCDTWPIDCLLKSEEIGACTKTVRRMAALISENIGDDLIIKPTYRFALKKYKNHDEPNQQEEGDKWKGKLLEHELAKYICDGNMFSKGPALEKDFPEVENVLLGKTYRKLLRQPKVDLVKLCNER